MTNEQRAKEIIEKLIAINRDIFHLMRDTRNERFIHAGNAILKAKEEIQEYINVRKKD